MGDMNCKIGNKMIKDNKKEVSKGGKVLLSLCSKMNLSVINGQECAEGTWTRTQWKDGTEEKSVLDYILTKKEDIAQIKKLTIDENKIKTPYRRNEDSSVTYTDHSMMILTTSLIIEKEEEERKCISEKGYQRLQEMMEKQEISKILDVKDFQRTYAEWSDKVLQLVDECSIKRKKSKGWKVNRKLESIRKAIRQKLKDVTLDKETVRLLKVEKGLITDHIEWEMRKKHYQKVNMEIDKIKKEDGDN